MQTLGGSVGNILKTEKEVREPTRVRWGRRRKCLVCASEAFGVSRWLVGGVGGSGSLKWCWRCRRRCWLLLRYSNARWWWERSSTSRADYRGRVRRRYPRYRNLGWARWEGKCPSTSGLFSELVKRSSSIEGGLKAWWWMWWSSKWLRWYSYTVNVC